MQFDRELYRRCIEDASAQNSDQERVRALLCRSEKLLFIDGIYGGYTYRYVRNDTRFTTFIESGLEKVLSDGKPFKCCDVCSLPAFGAKAYTPISPVTKAGRFGHCICFGVPCCELAAGACAGVRGERLLSGLLPFSIPGEDVSPEPGHGAEERQASPPHGEDDREELRYRSATVFQNAERVTVNEKDVAKWVQAESGPQEFEFGSHRESHFCTAKLRLDRVRKCIVLEQFDDRGAQPSELLKVAGILCAASRECAVGVDLSSSRAINKYALDYFDVSSEEPNPDVLWLRGQSNGDMDKLCESLADDLRLSYFDVRGEMSKWAWLLDTIENERVNAQVLKPRFSSFDEVHLVNHGPPFVEAQLSGFPVSSRTVRLYSELVGRAQKQHGP